MHNLRFATFGVICGLIILALPDPALAQAQPVITFVTEGYASLGPKISPGSYGDVAGTDLADKSENGPGNTKLFVNGVPCSIVSVTPTIVSFLMPAQIPVGPATVILSNNGVSSAPFSITVFPYSPGISGAYDRNHQIGHHPDGSIVTAEDLLQIGKAR